MQKSATYTLENTVNFYPQMTWATYQSIYPVIYESAQKTTSARLWDQAQSPAVIVSVFTLPCDTLAVASLIRSWPEAAGAAAYNHQQQFIICRDTFLT